MYDIFNLFPTAIYKTKIPYKINDGELNFIKSLDVLPKNGVSPSANFNILDSKELSNIKEYILEHLHNYVHNVIKIENKCNFYITESWINYMNKDGFHPPHIHPNSIVSGVFFIHGEYSPIVFLKNRNYPFYGFDFNVKEINNLNSNTFDFNNEIGTLLLFPSDTLHTVYKNQSDYVRVSLSFNTFVKGEISNNNSVSLNI